jgi:endonuclease V-like protein UPF0215 family
MRSLIKTGFIICCCLSFEPSLIHAQSQTMRQAQSQQDIRFPDDSGVINVQKQYGATGDGKTDDTAAILKAIGDKRGIFQRILYFPAGTYLVSDPLYGRAQDGTWRARITFQGENKATTIIRLKDSSPDFQDPHSPKAVIQTGSIQPYNKQTGAGNNGFRNYIFDLTIDTGKGNPGAIGIDYLGNNVCGLEDVTIKTDDPQKAGVAGLSMRRTYVGPCLYKRVDIDGFDYGVVTTSTEYSHTFEHLHLTGQRVAGISNSGNVLSIQDLESVNAVPAIINSDPKGLVTLIDSTLQSSGPSASAIVNSGVLLLRNIKVSGYTTTVATKNGSDVHGNVVEYLSNMPVHSGSSVKDSKQNPSQSTLNLPVEEAPELGSYNLAKWLNARSKGAIPDGKTDCTKGVQAALDSNAEVVYLTSGNCRVTDTLHVRGKTQKILGLGVVILPDGPKFSNESEPVPLLRFESTSSDLSIEGVQFGWWSHKNYPGTIWIEDASPRSIVLEHVDFEGVANAVYKAAPGRTGSLFIEDVEGFKWQFDAPQHIWAKQFDVEGNVVGSKIVNNGALLWILGLKTEAPQTVIDSENGGSTEVLGALLYPVHSVATEVPAFIVKNSTVSISYAVSANKPETNYQVHFQIMKDAATTNIKASDLTNRGNGTLGTVKHQ